MSKKHKEETILTHDENMPRYFGAVIPPLFQNSLFTFTSWEEIDQAFSDRTSSFFYSRAQNPTNQFAEKKIARLAGGESARLFDSGMAAISAAVLHFLKPKDHIVSFKNLYGPTNNLLTSYLPAKMGIDTTLVCGEKISDFAEAIKANTSLIYLESPSSVVFSLQDIKAVAKLAKGKKIPTVIDNTWATPCFQKPLEMGIDLELHSCSKYLGGHSDIVGGVIIGKEDVIRNISVREGELLGGTMTPFTAWLLLRSLRSLPARLKQHQASARKIAACLQNHPEVELVRYPGLSSFPQYELARKQMQGTTGLMSFVLKTKNLEQIKTFVNSLQIFRIGVSWGGHESLIYAPAISYHRELSEEKFKQTGISFADMRISVGLENCEDLMEDLKTALASIN